jgi:phospholipase D
LRDGTEAPVPNPRITHTVFSYDGSSRSLLVENYFCPEDACADHVLPILRAANRSVKFFIFSFTDDEIGDALVERAAAGVNVSGVFDRQQESKYSEYTGLRLAGLDVRHDKVFIVDDEIVVTGSYNPTGNGNERNDENVLIIHDASIARQYVTEFERVYSNGTNE